MIHASWISEKKYYDKILYDFMSLENLFFMINEYFFHSWCNNDISYINVRDQYNWILEANSQLRHSFSLIKCTFTAEPANHTVEGLLLSPTMYVYVKTFQNFARG